MRPGWGHPSCRWPTARAGAKPTCCCFRSTPPSVGHTQPPAQCWSLSGGAHEAPQKLPWAPMAASWWGGLLLHPLLGATSLRCAWRHASTRPPWQSFAKHNFPIKDESKQALAPGWLVPGYQHGVLLLPCGASTGGGARACDAWQVPGSTSKSSPTTIWSKSTIH